MRQTKNTEKHEHSWEFSFLNSGSKGINSMDRKRICKSCGKIEVFINTPIPPPVGSETLMSFFNKWH